MTARTTPPAPWPVTDLFPELRGRERVAVRLHPRPGAPRSPLASKLGGPFAWPVGEPWPMCSAAPLSFGPRPREEHGALVAVLQLRRDEIPELGFPDGTDLCQVLWCPRDHLPDYAPRPSVFWRSLAELADAEESSTPLRQPGDYYVPDPCRLFPERVVEYPPVMELEEDVRERVFAWEKGQGKPRYQWALSTAPGVKAGGYASWVQEPAVPQCGCARSMEHLLTIASAEFDGGTWERWLPEEDRRAWGAPFAQRRLVQTAHDLRIGDMGSVMVFVCRACPGWPTASVCR